MTTSKSASKAGEKKGSRPNAAAVDRSKRAAEKLKSDRPDNPRKQAPKR